MLKTKDAQLLQPSIRCNHEPYRNSKLLCMLFSIQKWLQRGDPKWLNSGKHIDLSCNMTWGKRWGGITFLRGLEQIFNGEMAEQSRDSVGVRKEDIQRCCSWSQNLPRSRWEEAANVQPLRQNSRHPLTNSSLVTRRGSESLPAWERKPHHLLPFFQPCRAPISHHKHSARSHVRASCKLFLQPAAVGF